MKRLAVPHCLYPKTSDFHAIGFLNGVTDKSPVQYWFIKMHSQVFIHKWEVWLKPNEIIWGASGSNKIRELFKLKLVMKMFLIEQNIDLQILRTNTKRLSIQNLSIHSHSQCQRKPLPQKFKFYNINKKETIASSLFN